MKIEYEVTVQDDLNAEQTYREFRLNLSSVKWIYRGVIALVYIYGFCLILAIIISFSEPQSTFFWGLWLLYLISCVAIPYLVNPKFIQSQWNRRLTAKKYSKYYLQQNTRSITVAEQQLVFATQNSEEAWKWQALKCFYEGTNSFMFSFFTGHYIFISKRGFAGQSQIGKFKSLVQEYADIA